MLRHSLAFGSGPERPADRPRLIHGSLSGFANRRKAWLRLRKTQAGRAWAPKRHR